jgi:hypothetical protein
VWELKFSLREKLLLSERKRFSIDVGFLLYLITPFQLPQVLYSQIARLLLTSNSGGCGTK